MEGGLGGRGGLFRTWVLMIDMKAPVNISAQYKV